MDGWLLGKEAFIELLSGKVDPAVIGVIQWAKERGEDSLYVSEITWAVVRSNAESSSGLKRQSWLDLLDHEVPRQFGTRLLPVDHALLEIWSRIATATLGAVRSAKDTGTARRRRASVLQGERAWRTGSLDRHLRLHRSAAGSFAAGVGRPDRPTAGQPFRPSRSRS